MNTNYSVAAAVASSRDSRQPNDMLELKRDEQSGRFSRCVIMTTQLPRMLQEKNQSIDPTGAIITRLFIAWNDVDPLRSDAVFLKAILYKNDR